MSLFTTTKPNLTQDTLNFIEQLEEKGDPPLYTLTPEEARQVLINAQSGPIAKPEVEIRDMDLPVGPTGNVSVRLVRPKGAKANQRCIFYLYGGGWVMGNKQTHDRLIRELATEVGAAVIFPEYTPSPDAMYPTSLEQCYAVLDYAGRNCEELGIDSDEFVIAGDSVGGNMATVLAMMSRERGGPKIIFQVLFYPVTDANFDTPSYKEFSEGPWLTRKAMRWFWDQYLPENERRTERNASPLHASLQDLQTLPPALIITAENDVLRDDGEEYAKKLDEADVRVSCVRVNGTMHDFVMLDALANTAPARSAICLAVCEIKRAFQHHI